MQIWNKIQI